MTTPLNLAGQTYADLASLGFAPRTDNLGDAGSGPHVSIGGGAVNALLFGAQ